MYDDPVAIVELYSVSRRLVEKMKFVGRFAPEQAEQFANTFGEIVSSGTVFSPPNNHLSTFEQQFVPDGELSEIRFAQPDAVRESLFGTRERCRMFVVKLNTELDEQVFGEDTLETRIAAMEREEEEARQRQEASERL